MIAPMQLTERDREIIRLINRHRFLRSHQIIALVGGSPQQILRRLQLLYHHGFLERPRSQLDSYNKGGSHHMVYGLGNKSVSYLKRELGFAEVRFGEKNRAAGRVFFDHAVLVSDVMVAIELDCRKTEHIRLLYSEELSLPKNRQLFRWKVKVDGGLILSVVPDRVFALEYPDASGQKQRAYFFLEADRGTMPVVRRNLSQTSFRRKLLAYEATWKQNLHHSRFGFNRFRVLTVTTSAKRVNSLVEACSQLKSGHGLFLFADRTILKNILSESWHTGRPGEMTGIQDLPKLASHHA
jgi:hypothetical protein